MRDIYDYLIECNIPLLDKVGDKWNGRCIICGDSKKSNRKKRFWILPSKKSSFHYNCYCHNCGYSSSFILFLKRYFPDVHTTFFKDNFKKKRNKKKEYKKTKNYTNNLEKITTINLKNNKSITKLINLSEDHIANQYIKKRKIPKIWKKYLLYSDNFKKSINEKIPDKFKFIPDSDKRLIIPFYTLEEKKIFAVAGRTLENAEQRYLTIKFDENYPKIFGLERVDFTKKVIVTEGQIDSLFLPNSIAMGGSISNVKKLLEYGPIENFILVPDIEPRNKEITNFIEKSINIGFSVSLLPQSLKKYGKDINDIILNSNLTNRDIYNIINQNIYSGLNLKIKFKMWKKIK